MDIKNRKIIPILQRYLQDPETLVLTGFRRVGKTTVMRFLFDQLKTPNKLYLDLESPVNQQIFLGDNYDTIPLKLASLGLDPKQPSYLFLDEVQTINTLPTIIKYLYDHYHIKFLLTGSSSFYLKNLFSESLAGRKYLFELFPLDFEEFLWFKNSQFKLDTSPALLAGFYEEYLTFGGFPAVALETDLEKKRQKLDDVLGSYFEIDVKRLANFRDNDNLKRFMFLLANRVGNKIGINKIGETLGVSRNTIYEYLAFFEQTYLIHLVKPLSGSKDVQLRSIPKLYFNDTGILNRLGQISEGQIFENKVYNQLSTRLGYLPDRSVFQDQIHYYQLKSGVEIDFIVNGKHAYEVKLQATTYDVNKLARTSSALHLVDYQVISLHPSTQSHPLIHLPYSL